MAYSLGFSTFLVINLKLHQKPILVLHGRWNVRITNHLPQVNFDDPGDGCDGHIVIAANASFIMTFLGTRLPSTDCSFGHALLIR